MLVWHKHFTALKKPDKLIFFLQIILFSFFRPYSLQFHINSLNMSGLHTEDFASNISLLWPQQIALVFTVTPSTPVLDCAVFYLCPTSLGQNSVVHAAGCYCEQITALSLHILWRDGEGRALSHTGQLRHCQWAPAHTLSPSWPETHLAITIPDKHCFWEIFW